LPRESRRDLLAGTIARHSRHSRPSRNREASLEFRVRQEAPLRATPRAYYENSRSPAISRETDACLTSHFHNFHLHLYSLIIPRAKFPKHNDVYVIIPRAGMSTHAATVHSRACARARARSGGSR